MNDHSRQLVRAATGPIMLITVGTLFALEKFTPYRFGQTWPVLLIIAGLLKLFGGGRPRRARYRGVAGPPPNPFPPPPPGPSGWNQRPNPAASGSPFPSASAPPPYSHPGEPMPDMTPPPPPRPGERR